MRKGIVFLLSWLCIHSAGADIYSDDIGVEPGSKEQLTKQVLLMLFAHSSMPIGDIGSCKSFYPSKSQKATLGNYVATQISYLSEAGENMISGQCIAINEGKRCEISFGHSVRNTEIASDYGLKFTLDSKGKIKKSTLECTGAG